jgi:hypothetical protein
MIDSKETGIARSSPNAFEVMGVRNIPETYLFEPENKISFEEFVCQHVARVTNATVSRKNPSWKLATNNLKKVGVNNS